MVDVLDCIIMLKSNELHYDSKRPGERRKHRILLFHFDCSSK